MSAKGMKTYYKYESMEMETAGKFFLNLAYGKKDYFLTIPLVTTRGSDKIALSAIYSSDNSAYRTYGEQFSIGDKCNLILSPKITQIVSHTKIAITYADGDVKEFLYKNDNTYENADSHSKVQFENNEYILINNDGDKLYYSGAGQLAYKVVKADTTAYNISVENETILISNSLSSVLEVKSSESNVSEIIYTENNEVITRVSFVYENGSLIGVKYYESSFLQYENKYDFNVHSIKLLSVKDGYSNNSFELTQTNLYSLSKYNLTNNHKIAFVRVQYNSDNTVVTDVFDNTVTYYFNSDNTCKYCVDSLRNYTMYTYDDTHEVLKCGAMQYNSDNLLVNGDLQVTKSNNSIEIKGFDWGGTALKIENVTGATPFSQFGYDSVLHIETPEKTQSGETCLFSLSQTLERSITLNDSFEFSFLVKNNAVSTNPNSKVEIYLALIGESGDFNVAAKYDLDLSKSDYTSWQLTTLSIVAEQSYSKLQVLVRAEANVSFDVGGFRLIALKKSVDITYNGEGKIETVSTTDREKAYSYNGYKTETSTDSDGNFVHNYYDDKNRLVKVVYPNGTIRTYQYNDRNNKVTCDTMTSYRYTMSTKTQFDEQNNFVKTETAPSGFDTEYQYSQGVVSQVKNPMGTATNYEYYHNLDLKSLNVASVTNGFRYNGGNLIFAETDDKPRYNFVYEDGNLQKVELLREDNATELCSYDYLEKNNTVTSLTTSKKYPNGEQYNFQYNSRGQIQSVSYQKDNESKNVASYIYDSRNGKLLSATDENDGRTTSYTYDMEGRVTQINSISPRGSQKYRYYYDAASNLRFQIKKYLSFENYSETLPLSRSASISMEGLIHSYKTQDYYTAFFQNNFDLSNRSGAKSPTKTLSAEYLTHYNALPCFRNAKNYSLTYNFSVADSNAYSQTAGFWFKFINKPTAAIEVLRFGSNMQALGVYYVVASRKLQIKRGTLKIYDSNVRIDPDEWNFISLTQTKQGSNYQYELCINGEIEIFSSSITTAAPSAIAIGGDTSKGSFVGYIAGVIVGNSAAIGADTLIEYYRYTKDLLIEVEEGSFSSLLNYYTFFNDCTIIPLHQNLKDVEQNIGPSKTIPQKPFDFDRDYIFNYNRYAKRYMYKCNGSPLLYRFNDSKNEATVSLCFVLDKLEVPSGSTRTLFSLTSNSQTVLFSVDADNIVRASLSGGISLGKIECNKLYFICFTYKYVDNELSYYVYLNNEAVAKGGHDTIPLGGKFSISLGGTFNGGIGDALRGSIDMFMVRKTYTQTSIDFQRLVNQATVENVSRKYNELGLLQEYFVSTGDNEIFKTTYTPQETDGKLSGLIQREQNAYFDHTYEYDKNGRIIKVDDGGLYKYNEYGYLVEDNDYQYAYDSHGNILTKYIKSTQETIEYKYDDPRSADLLTSYNGISVVYDEQNVGNLKSYGGIQFGYEGRRLTSYNDGIKTVSFKYNADGLRTEKAVNATGTDPVTVKYVYEGDRLLYETKNGVVTRFVYDDNGMLYGFINNSVRYYYVRDLQQRIVAIVNESGAFVAGYNYDSFGITTELLGDVEIARINPFRYKGYYYDNETGFYYCKTRYYNPYWGRWLTADDIAYLEPRNINGLNLFAYCGNNPIVGYDPNGTYSLWDYLGDRITNWWNKLVWDLQNLPTKIDQTITAVLSNFTFEVGIGGGYGGGVQLGPIGIDAMVAFNVIDIYYAQGAAFVSVGKKGNISFGMGTPWYIGGTYNVIDQFEPYGGEIIDNSHKFGAFWGVSASYYLGIGGTAAVGFDVIGLFDSLNNIWR